MTPNGLIPGFRIALLNMRRVFQHNSRQVARGVCAEYITGIPLFHEIWKVAAMIDMRMAEDGYIYLSRIKRKILVSVVGF